MRTPSWPESQSSNASGSNRSASVTCSAKQLGSGVQNLGERETAKTCTCIIFWSCQCGTFGDAAALIHVRHEDVVVACSAASTVERIVPHPFLVPDKQLLHLFFREHLGCGELGNIVVVGQVQGTELPRCHRVPINLSNQCHHHSPIGRIDRNATWRRWLRMRRWLLLHRFSVAVHSCKTSR